MAGAQTFYVILKILRLSDFEDHQFFERKKWKLIFGLILEIGQIEECIVNIVAHFVTWRRAGACVGGDKARKMLRNLVIRFCHCVGWKING